MFLQTLNIEWGQIDPKDNRRVNSFFYFHTLKTILTRHFREHVITSIRKPNYNNNNNKTCK